MNVAIWGIRIANAAICLLFVLLMVELLWPRWWRRLRHIKVSRLPMGPLAAGRERFIFWHDYPEWHFIWRVGLWTHAYWLFLWRRKPSHVRCADCNQVIDPDSCWCGAPIDNGIPHDNHAPIPMGCTCFRTDSDADYGGDGLGQDSRYL